MRKELLLTVFSVVVTLVIAFIGIKHFAPQLLGLPADLQLVKVGEVIAPFFDGVFRESDTYSSHEDFILKDPYTRVRAKPLYPNIGGIGPHDILGFRNLAVPNSADIIIIGDSQTYGNNALISNNWPGHLGKHLDKEKVKASIYNMSVGGWGSAQYLYISEKAKKLKPRAIIVAYYTGNDPIDSFLTVYGIEKFSSLRINSTLSANDAPPGVKLKSTGPENWHVNFKDGVSTTFTPKYRLASNKNHPAVDAGYEIMAKTAFLISQSMKESNIATFFTIIPTKEYAYYPKIMDEKIDPRKDYLELISAERKRIQWFSKKLKSIDGATYIDIIEHLQRKSLEKEPLYLENVNGHPISLGYKVIGNKLGSEISKFLKRTVIRKVVAYSSSKNKYQIYLINEKGRWLVTSTTMLNANGWSDLNASLITQEELFSHADRGTLLLKDKKRFGPIDN